jgi:hypothetical protein
MTRAGPLPGQSRESPTGAGDSSCSTVTLLNGSLSSTAGKTTNQSASTAAATSSVLPTSLPGRPPGSRCQIQPYTPQPSASAGGASPDAFDNRDSSSPKTTYRRRAENFGWQLVNVIMAFVGLVFAL